MSALSTGTKVLAGLDRGRRIAIEKAREQVPFWRRVIAQYALIDAKDGNSTRGRSRRIAEMFKGKLSRRQVQRYLDNLSSMSRSGMYGASNNFGGLTP